MQPSLLTPYRHLHLVPEDVVGLSDNKHSKSIVHSRIGGLKTRKAKVMSSILMGGSHTKKCSIGKPRFLA